MKLQNIKIKNFKGMAETFLEFNGKSAKITGHNGAGKTRVISAFNWLLTGKDEFGIAQFDIKPVDEQGNLVRGDNILECIVEADFIRTDGTKFKLQRVLKENWVKPSGKTEREYRGDQTLCYVDGVPRPVGEYNKFIEENFAEEGVLRLLTNTSYFNEQTKSDKERRDLLFETFGDLTDKEIISANEELAPLLTLLEGRTVDDYSLMLKATLKRTNDDLDDIPIRIDEASKSITEGVDSETAKTKLAELELDITTLQNEIEDIKKAQTDNSDTAELESKIRVEKRKLASTKADWESNLKLNQAELDRKFNEEIGQLKEDYQASKLTLQYNEKLIANLESTAEELKEKRQKYADEWSELNSQEFEPDLTCPTCKQEYPESYVDEARGNWNENHSSKLLNIENLGKQTRAELDKATENLEQALQEKDGLLEAVETAETALKTAEGNRVAYQPSEVELKAQSVTEQVIAKEIERLTDLLEQKEEGTVEIDVSAQLAQIEKMKQEQEEQRRIVALAENNVVIQKRIDEYSERQKELVAIRDNTNKELHLCDKFLKSKSKTISDNINQHFQIVRFELFEELKNGGVREVCEATAFGKSYSGNAMNRALKIAASLDIIKTFGDKLGLNFPVFIDDNEGIYETYGVDTGDIQVIKLEAVDGEQKLEVALV